MEGRKGEDSHEDSVSVSAAVRRGQGISCSVLSELVALHVLQPGQLFCLDEDTEGGGHWLYFLSSDVDDKVVFQSIALLGEGAVKRSQRSRRGCVKAEAQVYDLFKEVPSVEGSLSLSSLIAGSLDFLNKLRSGKLFVLFEAETPGWSPPLEALGISLAEGKEEEEGGIRVWRGEALLNMSAGPPERVPVGFLCFSNEAVRASLFPFAACSVGPVPLPRSEHGGTGDEATRGGEAGGGVGVGAEEKAVMSPERSADLHQHPAGERERDRERGKERERERHSAERSPDCFVGTPAQGARAGEFLLPDTAEMHPEMLPSPVNAHPHAALLAGDATGTALLHGAGGKGDGAVASPVRSGSDVSGGMLLGLGEKSPGRESASLGGRVSSPSSSFQIMPRREEEGQREGRKEGRAVYLYGRFRLPETFRSFEIREAEERQWKGAWSAAERSDGSLASQLGWELEERARRLSERDVGFLIHTEGWKWTWRCPTDSEGVRKELKGITKKRHYEAPAALGRPQNAPIEFWEPFPQCVKEVCSGPCKYWRNKEKGCRPGSTGPDGKKKPPHCSKCHGCALQVLPKTPSKPRAFPHVRFFFKQQLEVLISAHQKIRETLEGSAAGAPNSIRLPPLSASRAANLLRYLRWAEYRWESFRPEAGSRVVPDLAVVKGDVEKLEWEKSLDAFENLCGFPPNEREGVSPSGLWLLIVAVEERMALGVREAERLIMALPRVMSILYRTEEIARRGGSFASSWKKPQQFETLSYEERRREIAKALETCRAAQVVERMARTLAFRKMSSLLRSGGQIGTPALSGGGAFLECANDGMTESGLGVGMRRQDVQALRLHALSFVAEKMQILRQKVKDVGDVKGANEIDLLQRDAAFFLSAELSEKLVINRETGEVDPPPAFAQVLQQQQQQQNGHSSQPPAAAAARDRGKVGPRMDGGAVSRLFRDTPLARSAPAAAGGTRAYTSTGAPASSGPPAAGGSRGYDDIPTRSPALGGGGGMGSPSVRFHSGGGPVTAVRAAPGSPVRSHTVSLSAAAAAAAEHPHRTQQYMVEQPDYPDCPQSAQTPVTPLHLHMHSGGDEDDDEDAFLS
uniref:Uncharacterized protein n=1 Tax=Chromera velia CCMP2878 TaxID=1169474 RepID=A0A0G4GZP3_9ALVE|eukprot:Cvel_24062.t1-p1 / transcript=Cvel_24062.t1 / gene=Cvel_24062 / organism=Chromera_velia_CCMP2878 / gene_product=hypothetical protein / transcript_product=hypothetical protein / location=Cvel_scaffold2560:12710-18780(+) / protein_length=1086 / sequence_SO=supercontig / SO=protein_coding / is_pseudo=false